MGEEKSAQVLKDGEKDRKPTARKARPTHDDAAPPNEDCRDQSWHTRVQLPQISRLDIVACAQLQFGVLSRSSGDRPCAKERARVSLSSSSTRSSSEATHPSHPVLYTSSPCQKLHSLALLAARLRASSPALSPSRCSSGACSLRSHSPATIWP